MFFLWKFDVKAISFLNLFVVPVSRPFFSVPVVEAQEEIQHVLIINSYHQGYGWANDVMSGIYETLIASRKPLDIHIEYMDTKRYPAESLYTEYFALYEQKYDYDEIDLLIIADDNALNFILSYYDTFSEIPLVFCGLSYLEKYDFSQYPLITGIGESSRYLENIRLIETLQPEIKKIALVAGATPTAETGVLSFRAAVAAYDGDLQFQEIWNMPLEDVFTSVEALDDDTAIILIPFARDSNVQFIDYQVFIELLSRRTNLPIYSAFSFQVIDHVVGGMIIDGYIHGTKTAQIGLSLLEGVPASEFPIVYDGGHGYLFNYEELIARGIPISKLPKGSEMMNEPNSIFYQFQKELISLALLLLSLVGIIGFLWFTISKQRAMEQELQHLVSHDALTALHNRNAFYKKLEQIQSGESRYQFPIGIVFLDINGLKRVNDAFGHRVGDEYIQTMANVLKEIVNPDDFISRIGGDEFVCILNHINQAQLERFMQQLHKEIRQKGKDIHQYIFSSSLGAVICHRPEDLLQAIHEADLAMYEEKKKHPNRTQRLPSIKP